MRSFRTILALSGAFTLAACGGDTGPQTVGGVAPPAGPSPVTPTPTHSFVAPTEPKTYEGLGAVQHYEYYTYSNTPQGRQGGQLYGGDANTVRDSGISITYNPRDAIFDLTITRPKGIVSVPVLRFQDPVHRTDFAGVNKPQIGVPDFSGAGTQLPSNAVPLAGIQYLDAGSSTTQRQISSCYARCNSVDPQLPPLVSDYPNGTDQYNYNGVTLFYQKPGTTTKYVTYAGFVRNQIIVEIQQPDPTTPSYLRNTYYFDRAAFVFGERTPLASIPKSGSGTFSGDMIASLVHNNQLDIDPLYPTYIQWMMGSQKTTIDFAALSVKTDFTGTVLAPAMEAYTTHQPALAAGTVFTAFADSTIDLVNKGGFTGQFGCASFAGACVRGQAVPAGALLIAGSSIDGAFFGPNGEEIGGGFRVVGGTPDQRIDVVGAFTGKK